MDLRYLLLLQQLRESSGDLMTSFMMTVTNIAMFGSAILCVIIFWAVDRVFGYWLITNTVSGLFLNNVIKLTACVYRPWVRWPQLDPPEKAIESATGYSFPSGHTALAFTGAVILDKEYRHVSPWISVAGYAVATGVAVDRMARNRHAWQDVTTGAAIGVGSTLLGYWLGERITGEHNRYAVTTDGQSLSLCIQLFNK